MRSGERPERILVAGLLLMWAASGCGFFSSDTGSGGGLGRAGVGEDCLPDQGDCRPGLVCREGTCQPPGTKLEGAPCQLSGECMDGLYCGPRRTCVPAGEGVEGDPCTSTADCIQGYLCALEGFFGTCKPTWGNDLGDPCSAETDCVAGLSCIRSPGAAEGVCGDPPPVDADRAPPVAGSWAGALCPEESSGEPTAHFRVPRGEPEDEDFYRLPFPNDIRRRDGHIDLSGHPRPGDALALDVVGRHLDAVSSAVDGFSLNPVVYFRLSERHDFDSLGDQVEFVNLQEGDPNFGRPHPSITWLSTYGGLSNYICPNWFAVRPAHGAPLEPHTTYGVIVHRGLRTTTGAPYARSEDFEAMLANERPVGDEALAAAWDAYAPLRAWIATGQDPDDILVAAVFTTQDVEQPVSKLREAVYRSAPPTASEWTLCGAGVTSPCDDGTPLRSCAGSEEASGYAEIHGLLQLPVFQEGTAPYLTPEDGGGVPLDANGLPIEQRREAVCFALTVPSDSDPPPGGWPTVIALHGTGGSFRTAVGSGLAEALAAEGVATLAIDLPQHGSRRGDSDRPPEYLFFNFANPPAARGNVLQGAADLFALVRWANDLSLDASTSPTGRPIEIGPLALFAHSQGATHASLALPWEPALRAAVLSGDGGDLTLSLLHKRSPVDIAALIPFALVDATRDGTLAGGDFHPALAIFQTYYDAVDPVAFGRRIHRAPVSDVGPHHVFLTYGLGDTFSPEPTMQAYARSVRATLVEPVLTRRSNGAPDTFGLPSEPAPLSGNVTVEGARYTVALRQYEPPDGVDGHFVAQQEPTARADVQRFLLAALRGQTPTVGTSP